MCDKLCSITVCCRRDGRNNVHFRYGGIKKCPIKRRLMCPRARKKS